MQFSYSSHCYCSMFTLNPKNPNLRLRQIAAFAVPVLLFALLWYQVALGRSILSIFHHNDFLDVIPVNSRRYCITVFCFQFPGKLWLGAVFFLAATAFSLILGLCLQKKKRPNPCLADFSPHSRHSFCL